MRGPAIANRLLINGRETENDEVPVRHRRLRGPVLLQLWCRVQLQRRWKPWPRSFHMWQIWERKNGRKEETKEEERREGGREKRKKGRKKEINRKGNKMFEPS